MKEKEETKEVSPDTKCPFCHSEGLIVMEDEREIPYFGPVYIFSMTCNNCKFHKADVELVEEKEPTKYSIEVSGEEDMKIRIVKASSATVKIPHITTIEPGEASNGYVTNIEGILSRVKNQLENLKDDEEDEETQKKARNMIKKINRCIWGEEKLRIILEDPAGNSAIISDKAAVEKLKK